MSIALPKKPAGSGWPSPSRRHTGWYGQRGTYRLRGTNLNGGSSGVPRSVLARFDMWPAQSNVCRKALLVARERPGSVGRRSENGAWRAWTCGSRPGAGRTRGGDICQLAGPNNGSNSTGVFVDM